MLLLLYIKMRIFFLLLLISLHIKCFSQYKYTGKLFTDNYIITPTANFSGKIGYKGYQNKLRIYQNISDSNNNILIIKSLNLTSLIVDRIDTLNDSAQNFYYENFIAGENSDIFIGSRKILVYNRSSLKHYIYYNDFFIYKNGFLINDSVLLLYRLDNFHPADGSLGLHLTLFNINNQKIINDKIEKYNGILFSNIHVDVGLVNKNNFYIVSPMSGILYKYDFHLHLIDSVKIPIQWENIKGNLAYQSQMDSTIYVEYSRMKLNYKKTGNYGYNKIYTNNFITGLNNEVRQYDYIEKLIPYNDSLILVSLYRAEYGNDKRDILFYNVNTNKIVNEFLGWQCDVKKDLKGIEDYFAVNVAMSSAYAPYFYDKSVYYASFANPLIYEGERNRDDLLMKIVNDGKKNGHSWRFLEYKF